MTVRFRFLALALLCGCMPPKVKRFSMQMPERRASLPNGMRVIVLPDDTTDLVEVDVRYGVGANEDPKGKEGLAHLVEHLMYQQRLAGEDKPPIGAAIRANAIYVNAFTRNDSTQYQTLARRESFDQIISLEAARLSAGCTAISEQEFEREREVVRNEIRLRAGQDDSVLYHALLAAIYPEGHPYRHDPGGNDATVANLTLQDACGFMERYYTPGNATLIIAGNVDEDDVNQSVGEWLVGIPGRATAEPAEVPRLSPRDGHVELELDVDETRVYVAWPLPPLLSKEGAAIPFLESRIRSRLSYFDRGVGDAKIAWASTDIIGGARAPALVLTIVLKKGGAPSDALDLVDEMTSRAHWGFRDADFSLAKFEIKQYVAMGLESLGARTDLYGDFAQLDPEQQYFAGEMAHIDALNGDLVSAMIKRTLSHRAAVVVVRPRKKKQHAALARADVSFRPNESESPEAPLVDPAMADQPVPVSDRAMPHDAAKRFALDNGLHVVLLPMDSHMPIVSGAVVFGVGDALDSDGKAGLADVAADALNRSSNPDTWANDDYTVRKARALDMDLDDMIRDLAERTSSDEVNKAVVEARRKRFAELDASDRRYLRFRRTLAEAVFGKLHPYATVVGLTDDITTGDIAKFQREHYVAANATVILTGRFDTAEAEKLIRKRFGGWPAGQRDPRVTAKAAHRGEPAAFAVVDPDRDDVSLLIAFTTPPGVTGAHAARLILAAMLSRRATAVREVLGASYVVEGRLDVAVGPGMYELGGVVDAKRGVESFAALQRAIQELRDGKDFAETFALARQAVLQEILGGATDSAAVRDQLVFLAVHGLPADFYDKLMLQVANARPKQVRELLETDLPAAGEVVIASGRKGELEALFHDLGVTVSYDE